VKKLILLNLIILCQFVIVTAGITDIRIAYICPNDNKDPMGIPQIPDAFLERAKKNNYTHILVGYFMINGDEMNGGANDWRNGIYNGGIFNDGGLFKLLNRDIAKIQSYGLDYIPSFGVGCTGAHWEEVIGTSIMDYYDAEQTSGAKNVVCIAPGKILQPDGFYRSFTHLCRVINEACEANSYNLQYIDLHYSEASQSGTHSQIWGTSKVGGVQSIDQKWILAAPAGTVRNVNDLVAASIEEKIDVLHNTVGNHLASTKVIIYGDMFSNEFQSAIGINLQTLSFITEQSNNSVLKNNVVFAPWWYSRNKYNRLDFNTEREFKQFTDAGFDIIPGRTICNGDNNHGEITLECIPELVESIRTSKNLQTHIIGYISFHWDNFPDFSLQGGYDNDPCWNTMEYLAYGNQVARPDTKFSRIPRGTIKGTNINPLLCSQTEITQGDYYSITGKFPFSNYASGNLNFPAENITFYDAIIYCNERSLREGLKPVYTFVTPQANDYNGENCTNLINLTADTSKNGYRLPSPAEWEYAYMAGTPMSSTYYWGSILYTDSNCWNSNNSNDSTHPVGQLSANAWKIYDVAGNVEEMTCMYGNPLMPGYAGGCFINSGESRLGHNSNYTSSTISPARWLGFRVVRKALPDLTPIINLLLD